MYSENSNIRFLNPKSMLNNIFQKFKARINFDPGSTNFGSSKLLTEKLNIKDPVCQNHLLG